MLTLKQLLEWYLGVPPSDPGQGTAWNFLWRSPWPGWLPDWAVLLLLAVLAAYVVVIYSKDASALSWKTRFGLISLRLLVLAMVLFFLSELKLSVDRTGLPVIVVLWDDSESMNFEDQYRNEDTALAVKRLLEAGEFTEATRFNLAKSLLTNNEGEFLKALLERHKLRIYRFSDNTVPVTLEDREELLKSDDVDELLPVLAGLKAEGELTRPGPAVQKVLDDLRGTPPSAIILLSDGITSTSDAEKLTTIAETARNKLVPIYTVAIGSEEPTRDLQIYGLLAEDFAFVNDPIAFTAKLKSYGFKDREIKVRLKQKGSDKILAEQTLKAGGDGEAVNVEISYAPPEKGEFEYILEIPLDSEETNANNNATLPQLVTVSQDPVRVLLADSMPRYEFRYLKHLLERESLREGNSTLKLDVVLQDADLEYSQEDETALEHFPVQLSNTEAGASKTKYDVIILGDVNPAYLSPVVFENIMKFVRDDGGGLIMVAGRRFNPLAYRDTPLETLLPIELSGARAPSAEMTITDPFPPSLTLEGRKSSSIFRFAESESESLKIWKELPPLYWLFEAPELKPGAVSFVEHPIKSGPDGNLPVICMHRYGAGKVMFHATDELWRWRFRRGDIYYGRYWIQAIRYLSRSQMLGKDRGAKLSTDREIYQKGDTVNLRLRFLDESLVPLEKDGVTVMVERRGDTQQAVQLTKLPQDSAVFEGQINRAAEGAYHAWVARPSFQEAPPSEDFLVESQSRELAKRSLDRAELAQTAETTRGQMIPLEQAEDLPSIIPPGQPVPLETQEPISLWNRPEFLVLFALFLSAEWLWRKRVRLV